MNKDAIPIIIKVHENNFSDDNVVTLPVKIFYQISNSKKTKLTAGGLEMDVTCQRNNSKNIIELPISIAEAFGLCEDSAVNIIIKDKKICFGPFIGIFSSNGLVSRANAQAPHFRMIETVNANKDVNAIVYYFTINDVDFYKKRINGTYFDYGKESWEKKCFPYPNILYDRGGGTLNSQKIMSDYIREELEKDKKLIKINSRYFFDKWDLHKELLQYENIKQYLPLTVLWTKPEDLLQMFNKSSVLYIKDCLGSNGIGVARIIKHSDKDFELSHFFNRTFIYNLSSFEELLETIASIFEGKKVIIQSAINLLQHNNRNIDMRATVQKNESGKLIVTAFPVRLGKLDCPITSTISGSSVYRLDDFFKEYFNYSQEAVNKLQKDITNFLFTCFKCLEDIYGDFGELGIDYAIDKSGKIWFIECNAKPGKDTVYLSYDKDTIKKAFQNPLEYGKYLWRNSKF
jgi:hypothetical protein